MAVDNLVGPTPIIWPQIGLNPNPCDQGSEQANWGRLPQLIMNLQNQLLGTPSSSLVTALNNLSPTDISNLTTFITNLTSNSNFITAINSIITNWMNSNMTLASWVANWRYDTSSHKFQLKTQAGYVWDPGAVSGWTDSYAAVPETALTDWQYSASAHAFQYKTQQCYVLEAGTISAFGNTPGNQPAAVSHVTDVSWSSPTLSETKTQANCYVLEAGSTATTTIDTATAC